MPESYSEPLQLNASLKVRWGVFALFVAGAVILAFWPLEQLLVGGRSDYYSHILLIPFVSAYFLFIERRATLKNVECSWTAGICLSLLGLLMYGIAFWQREWLGANDFASLATAGVIILLWGGFTLAFGTRVFTAARFPWLFLLFSIPVPLFLLDWFIYVLQVGSTEVTQWLFDLTGTAYFRDGFVYQLAGITIEVAKECSGIRSSIALIITGVLAGHLFLRSGWKTVALLVALIPITILKNGIRILTLSLLAIYVDTKFITDSFLHHSGGFLFYLPALALMALMIWGLRRMEKRKVGRVE